MTSRPEVWLLHTREVLYTSVWNRLIFRNLVKGGADEGGDLIFPKVTFSIVEFIIVVV